jgi:3-oxoacyl-[acyl-carrier protein] reductase
MSARVALVTGSVRNIGRAIALGLAADGAAVVVHSKTVAPAGEQLVSEIREKGGRAIYCAADVSVEAEVARLVGEATKAFGRIDVLVNNAAIRRLSPIERMTLAEWREVMGANLDSAFLCARACLPHMGRGGRIINIGGLSAHRGAGQRAHVVASKAGIVGLTKALAIELAERGITVNCVVPGSIDTTRDANAGAIPPHPQGFDAPVGRQGRPEEIAAMVAYLAGERAAYVTGQTIHVNGGLYLP